MNINHYLKQTIRKALHLARVDVRMYTLHHSDDMLLKAILRHYGINTVVDVGGNEGQYAKGLIDHGYKGKIYSLEPIAAVFDILQRRSGKYPQWSAFNVAAGSRQEDLVINVSENFASSSLLKVTEGSLIAEPKTRIIRQEKIKVITLDSFWNQHPLLDPVLLKLDVQGYELEALRGAMKILPRIKIVQAELSFVPLYAGAPLFQEVVDFMKEHGFEIYSIMPGFRNGDTGRMLQADGIFVRKP